MLPGIVNRGELRDEAVAGFGRAERGDAAGGEVENLRQLGIERSGERLPGVSNHQRLHREPDHERQVVIGGVFAVAEQAADEAGAEILVR